MSLVSQSTVSQPYQRALITLSLQHTQLSLILPSDLIWAGFDISYLDSHSTMRTTLLSLGALAGFASANIDFHWVQPACDFNAVGSTPCLRGQHCSEKNM